MALKLITPPLAEPVSLGQAKDHCRVDGDTENSFITSLIVAAREYCEGYQRRAYVTQTWELWLDACPDKDHITIPRPPLQTVTSVKYYGTDNVEYTMDPVDYFVDNKSEPGRLALTYMKSWPTITLRPVNAVVVEFTAGYPPVGGDPPDPAGNVPQMVKQAMLLLIGHWHENREAVLTGSISKEIEFAVKAILRLDRVISV